MKDFVNRNNPFSQEAIERYTKLKNDKRYQFTKWTRDFHKQQQDRKTKEAEYYPAPQVGFGATYTHTFAGDAEDDGLGGNLNYQA